VQGAPPGQYTPQQLAAMAQYQQQYMQYYQQQYQKARSYSRSQQQSKPANAATGQHSKFNEGQIEAKRKMLWGNKSEVPIWFQNRTQIVPWPLLAWKAQPSTRTDWNASEFESEDQKNKFLKLMGAKKPQNATKGSLATSSSSSSPPSSSSSAPPAETKDPAATKDNKSELPSTEILSRGKQNQVFSELEKQYNQSRSYSYTRSHQGLG